METDCNLNCDSILKKAKWLIIAAYICSICQLIINALGMSTLNKDPVYYLLINMMFDCAWIFLALGAILNLRKHSNRTLKQSMGILRFLIILYIIYFVSEVLCPSYFYYVIGNPIVNIPFIPIGILFTYFYITAYTILLNDKNIRKEYYPSIYFLCLGEIILRFSSIIPTTFSMTLLDSTTEFNQIHQIIKVLLNIIGYVLIIFGWKQLLSTPSQIPTTTSGTPISLKPTKIEYGYLVSCGVLIALLFIYFNSVSLDIFTK